MVSLSLRLGMLFASKTCGFANLLPPIDLLCQTLSGAGHFQNFFASRVSVIGIFSTQIKYICLRCAPFSPHLKI